MSRTNRVPVAITKSRNTRIEKRHASKAVRRVNLETEIPSGSVYKHYFPSYNIIEHKSFKTF